MELGGPKIRDLPDVAAGTAAYGRPMDDNRDEERTLSVRLDVQLDREPIGGCLRTDWGAEETFVGWLGFVDALRRLHDLREPETDQTEG